MDITSTTKPAIEDAIASTLSTSENTETPSNSATEEINTSSNGFTDYMYKALGLGESDEVNEEELFAAAIGNRLSSLNEEAAKYYEAQKAKLMTSMSRADGYVSVEDVANTALKNTVEAGKLSSEEAEKVKGECFLAAQLDNNLNALYDGRGSGEDATIAVAPMSAALLDIQTKLEQIDKGELSTESMSLESVSTSSSLSGSQEMDGSGGFLWKPVSESDGNLVVLLPKDLKGLIDKVEIHSELPPTEETKLAQGRFSGDTHNGGRAHFRFDKPGAEYGDNIHLVCYKDDGSYVSWDIGNGADRHD